MDIGSVLESAQELGKLARVFGSVSSRRLGRSLGVNNIIPKNYSYSRVYSQVGITINIVAEGKNYLVYHLTKLL